MLDDDFLRALHHVLLEVRLLFASALADRSSRSRSRPCPPRQLHVEEGAMVCPNCQHLYPISNGIPNMVRAPIPPSSPSPTRTSDVPERK